MPGWVPLTKGVGCRAQRRSRVLRRLSLTAQYGASRLLRPTKPIENLAAVPSDDPVLCQNVLVGSLHVADAMRRAREIIVMRHRHDLGAIDGFVMDAVEIFGRAG